ncbi:hypothetical protein [Occallatibacter riparius]|uniref:Uncharacterized protein n=1 Tax=Occallatibacter riparius TaxID=1002689 RepID=A0A9J7BUQ4_9BACT|nr:hypothetical protein [Occallatibacter riparius]UWZ84654.1 hypothetical protein MOP44_01665 [Occallatibacter riparius]
MKRTWILCSLLGLVVIGYGVVRYVHHRQWSQAQAVAQVAFQKAWLHKDDDDRVFSPYKNALFDAREAAEDIPAWGETDRISATKFSSCVSILNIYRSDSKIIALRVSDNQPADDVRVEGMKMATELDRCVGRYPFHPGD